MLKQTFRKWTSGSLKQAITTWHMNMLNSNSAIQNMTAESRQLFTMQLSQKAVGFQLLVQSYTRRLLMAYHQVVSQWRENQLLMVRLQNHVRCLWLTVCMWQETRMLEMKLTMTSQASPIAWPD